MRREGIVRGLRRLAREGHGSVRMRLPGAVVLEVLYRPGRWMDDAELVELTGCLRGVAKAGSHHGVAPQYGPLLGEREDLSRRVVSIARDARDERALGFSAMALIPVTLDGRADEVLHLGLLYVEPSSQRRDLVRPLYLVPLLMQLLLRGGRPFHCSSTSQVPAIIGWVGTAFPDTFPSTEPTARQTSLHRELAAQIFSQRRVFGCDGTSELDLDRQVIRRAFPGGKAALRKTLAEVRLSRDGAVNAWCEEALDYGRGDEVLQVGRVELLAVRTVVRHFVARLGPAGWALEKAFAGLVRVAGEPSMRVAHRLLGGRPGAPAGGGESPWQVEDAEESWPLTTPHG